MTSVYMSEEKVDLDIDELPGIGEQTTKKLNAIGIYTVADLALANASELAEIISNSSIESCKQMVIKSYQYLMEKGVLEKALMTSRELLNQPRTRCTTGCKSLDELLGGGLEAKAVTEFYGGFGRGKTQICYTSAVMATQPVEKGGLDGSVIYIDTENTFSPERIAEIARTRGLDPDQVGERIFVFTPDTSSILTLYMKELRKHVKEKNAKMVIVDSFIHLHRREFHGRGNLAPRQQELSNLMRLLMSVVRVYNLVGIITNQLLGNPNQFVQGLDNAAGGHIIAHASTHRVLLTPKGKGINATMVDSPRYAKREASFELYEGGVRDPSVKKG
jgi:DNA repair protein RadA